MHTIIATIALVLIPPFHLQDLNPCNTYGWVPDIPILSVQYWDFPACRLFIEEKTVAEEIFTFSARSTAGRLLPDSLLRGIVSIGKIETIKVKRFEPDTDESGRTVTLPGATTSMFFFHKGKMIGMANMGTLLHVIRYNDLKSHMRTAFTNGDIEPSGESVDNRPVFAINGMEEQHYCLATDVDILLVAPKIELIRSMYAAGSGQAASYCDSPDASGFFSLFGELGPYFSFSSRIALPKAYRAYILNHSDDPAEVASLETHLENRPLWSINTTVLRKDAVLNLMIEQYASAAIAENQLAHLRSRPGNEEQVLKALRFAESAQQRSRLQSIYDQQKPYFEYQKTENSKTAYSLDGSMVIRSVTWDVELLEARNMYREKMRNMPTETREKTRKQKGPRRQ